MAIDRNGAVHIVWPTLVDGPEPATRLFHASTADGITFTPRQVFQTLGSPKPAHPQMTLDRCGDLALVWDEAQDKTRRIALATLGTSAGSPTGRSVALNGELAGRYPVVATSGGGALIAAWTELGRDSEHSSIAVRRLESTCAQLPARTTD